VPRPSAQLVFCVKGEYRVPRVPEEESSRETWLGRTPSAPLPWWQQVVVLALEAVLMVLGARLSGRKAIVLAAPLWVALGWVGYPATSKLEERRARRLGLTMETAPERSPAGCLYTLPWLFAWRLYLRARQIKPAPTPWPEQLAAGLLSEWYRRRSWKRALGRIRAGEP
jgi:hypothetical protein